MSFWRRKTQQTVEFDEILMDVSNLPAFNTGRLEGRRELPITKQSIFLVALIFGLIALAFLSKIYSMTVVARWLFGTNQTLLVSTHFQYVRTPTDWGWGS